MPSCVPAVPPYWVSKMFYAILIVVLVALDQLTKYLVRANIPLGGSVEFLPGIMDFTYVKNTGMAFSMLSEHTWLLAVLSAAVTVFLIALLVKKEVTHPFGTIPLACVIAGAIGNLIDRVFFGFVTDMFRTLFINFAVFNVADICVVVGGIVFCVYYIFGYDKYEKKGEKKHDDPAADC